jgi:hypothetical protein
MARYPHSAIFTRRGARVRILVSEQDQEGPALAE